MHRRLRIRGHAALVLIFILVLLLAATSLQFGLDRTAAEGEPEDGGEFPSAASLLDFLGGVRQYVAYTMFIKTDKLHHAYYGNLKAEAELIPYYMLITLLDPNYISAYYEGSGIISAQGRIDEAIDFNLRGIEANPESADLYVSLADLYLQDRDYEKAKEAFASALNYDTEIVGLNLILSGLVSSYTALGEIEEARQVLMAQAQYNRMRLYDRDLDDTLRRRILYLVNTQFSTAIGEGIDTRAEKTEE